MLTAEFIGMQLDNGMSVNFATTDQTILAAQQNQQQLLAQTTVIDEQFVLQHDEEQTEIITDLPALPQPKHEQIPFEIEPEVIVLNQRVRHVNVQNLCNG